MTTSFSYPSTLNKILNVTSLTATSRGRNKTKRLAQQNFLERQKSVLKRTPGFKTKDTRKLSFILSFIRTSYYHLCQNYKDAEQKS